MQVYLIICLATAACLVPPEDVVAAQPDPGSLGEPSEPSDTSPPDDANPDPPTDPDPPADPNPPGPMTVARIGPIAPPNLSAAGASGLAFDGSPDPLVIDGFQHAIWRLRATTGAVAATFPLTGGEANVRSLVHDGARLLTVRDNSLASVANGTVTTIGPMGSHNFLSLAKHPVTGDLWLVDDCANATCTIAQGARLSRVDPSTGATTLVRDFGQFGVGQATSLAISNNGTFYVATLSVAGSAEIWTLDPVTGTPTFVTDAALGFVNIIPSLAFEPATNRLYGIEEQRLAQPRVWNLLDLGVRP